MTDVVFEVGTGVDDGRCLYPSGSTYNNSNNWVLMGWDGGNAIQTYFRFDNVTIPKDSEIISCVLRLYAYGDKTLTVANLKIHLEDADDPAYPFSGSDIISRSLTSGVNWSGISAWTDGNVYDSVDFSSELQTVVNRAGWASGQAVIVNVLNNGSSAGASRLPAAYEHSLVDANYEPPQLVVTYEEFAGSTIDSFSVQDTADADLPFNADSIESFSTQDIADAELPGQGETLDSFSVQNTADALSTTSPTLDSFSASDTAQAHIEAQGIISESFSVDDVAEGYIELESTGADSFSANDLCDAFNYSQWLSVNIDNAKQRFFFTLTGDADGTTDVEIPIESFYATKRTGLATYLQVVIPFFDYADEIANRTNGDMIIEIGYEVDGIISLRETILTVDLEVIQPPEGGENRSIILSGHRTITYGANLITLNRPDAIYRNLEGNSLVYRFSQIDPYANPGDNCIVGSDTFQINQIFYNVNALTSVMEIRELI